LGKESVFSLARWVRASQG